MTPVVREFLWNGTEVIGRDLMHVGRGRVIRGREYRYSPKRTLPEGENAVVQLSYFGEGRLQVDAVHQGTAASLISGGIYVAEGEGPNIVVVGKG